MISIFKQFSCHFSYAYYFSDESQFICSSFTNPVGCYMYRTSPLHMQGKRSCNINGSTNDVVDTVLTDTS